MSGLLEAIRNRGEKKTEFGYGILTADRHVKNMEILAGLDTCYSSIASKTISYHDVLQKAKKTLCYSNEDMIVKEAARISDTSKELDGIQLPKNTLMVFKHVLSTPRIDRDGDILRTDGAIVDPKMLLLWQHVHTLPIGKMLGVMEHTSKQLVLLSCIVDMNELSHDAAVMVDNDMARFSHGFRAIEWNQLKEVEGDITGPAGFEVKKFEIMEESIVSVPANTDAEVSEVIVGLVENGKLTSSIMKECGKTLREKMPVMVPSAIDLSELKGAAENEDERSDGNATGEKEQGAGEQPAPEEAESVSDEKQQENETKSDEVAEPPVEETKEVEVLETEETEIDGEKAGRKLNASYLKTIKMCVDDLKSILDTDKDMARGSQAICERCMDRLQKMIDDSSNEEEEKTETEFEMKDAMIYVAKATESDRSLLLSVLRSMEAVDKQEEITRQVKALFN